MRVDIYRRAESGHRFSYLAVPEGRVIPEEATNTDWETEARGLEGGAQAEQMDKYAIAKLEQQINEKGYAITSVNARVDAGD
ncbi:MAG: hypothetical protein H0W47_03010 [Polaromonas sp.]|uniref:DUF6139 family protein n=1 Tax=Polaromonas sp. TaxID=1869339 RepID=UPI00184E8915|nr:DUF6139 family protein [Polaromonas sp.]MBA3592754.1 hypothetical protein [Polaromonas sp.]